MANKTLNVRISLFGATAAKWTEKNPVLLVDEIGRERDTGKIKFGDGITAWKDLAYFGGDMDAAISAVQDKLTALQGSKEGVVKAADKLATARKINGITFDRTKDITITDLTALTSCFIKSLRIPIRLPARAAKFIPTLQQVQSTDLVAQPL